MPPVTVADFFTEATKCFGSIADTNYQPAVDLDAYNVNVPAALTTYAQGMATNSGSFLVGIDCESYQNADKGSIFAGMNTTTSDIFYIPQHTQSSGGAITANYCAFANFDSVVVCDSGVAYVRY